MKSLKILLLYKHPLSANAPTIMDHVNSFILHSSNDVITVNTELGFPDLLKKYSYDVIILHYSLFGIFPFSINTNFVRFIKSCTTATKIAFFQDEYQYCLQRFNIIKELDISNIYSLADTKDAYKIYSSCDSVKAVHYTLTGYVSDDLIKKSKVFSKPFSQRKIDFGYRARQLPFLLGKGAQEKTNIASEFEKNCDGLSYKNDLSSLNGSRIYGDDWYRFVSDCKAMLGVEAGVSLFDIDGSAEVEYNEYLQKNPNSSFDQVYDSVLCKYELSEKNIDYRTVSPRIFEAAAFKVCLVLFEGSYSNIIKPNVHYIPLKKDFSNIKIVFSEFNNVKRRNELVKNAYNDLISDGQYSFKQFINSFDEELAKIKVNKTSTDYQVKDLTSRLKKREDFYRLYLNTKVKFKKFIRKYILH